MPPRLATSVVVINAEKLHNIDTRNVDNLFGMWNIFSKCGYAIEEGRRLENLSWRIWNRETFCCEPQTLPASLPSIDVQRRRPGSRDLPELSASVDSAVSYDDESMECRHRETRPLTIRRSPRKASIEIHTSSRGQEKHLTSRGLEKMVVSIKEKKELEPLSPKIASAVPTYLTSTHPTPRPASPTEHHSPHSSDSSSGRHSSPESSSGARHSCGSDTSAEMINSHSIVRGFAPGHASSFRSNTHLAPSPVPIKSGKHDKDEEAKKKGGLFILGGSSGEDDSSFEDKMSASREQKSSLTAELRRSTGSSKKTTSFKDEVESRTINHQSHEDEDVFESDEEDDVIESAIEDEEDSSEWEDDGTDSGRSSVNDKQLFKRVDSKANLTSRRSLLTTMIHEPDRAAAIMEMASRSQPVLRRSRTSTPNGPSVTGTPQDDIITTTFDSHGVEIPRSKPIIMTTSNTHPPALSPRTTRRNMLATELTESLRKHLLWERQQKNTTANAVLKRRHTAHDMAGLKNYPPVGGGGGCEGTGSKNHSFHDLQIEINGYHEKGW